MKSLVNNSNSVVANNNNVINSMVAKANATETVAKAKAVETVATKKVAKVATKKVATKKVATKKVAKKIELTQSLALSTKNKGTYKENVLDVNASLKSEYKAFGGACKVLLALVSNKLTDAHYSLLKAMKKDSDLYKRMDELTKRSKSGNVSPFVVLQMLHKNEINLIETYKVANVER